MSVNLIDVLLVEDNINDAELTIRELKKITWRQPCACKRWRGSP